MDQRLETCVAASLAWYADVFAIHAIPTATERGLWRALGAAPPLHSAAKTLETGVREADVLAAVAPYDVCSVADSYGDLDLAPAGFAVLIDATWLWHEPLEPAPMPDEWARVADEVTLGDWVDRHGTAGVFPPAVLAHPAFTILTRRDGAGAVVHTAEAAVTVAHVFGDVPVPEWLGLAAALHPGRAVADYATGTALEEALDAGFTGVGPQLVWAR
jgi:hypothetical protein